MAIQRTFSILKPDVTRRNLTGAVNARIEAAGLRIVAQKRVHMSRAQAETFYGVHRERPFFGELVEMMTAAPVVVQVLEGERGRWRNLGEKMPPGFQPYYFTCENNGVVWMHSDRRLARFDPSMPPAPSLPLRALITHLSFSGSGRTDLPSISTFCVLTVSSPRGVRRTMPVTPIMSPMS